MGKETVTAGTLHTKGHAFKSPECYQHPVVRVCMRRTPRVSMLLFLINIHLMIHKGRAFTLPEIQSPSDMPPDPSLDAKRAQPSPARLMSVDRLLNKIPFLVQEAHPGLPRSSRSSLGRRFFLPAGIPLTNLRQFMLNAVDVWHGAVQEHFDLATGLLLLGSLGATMQDHVELVRDV